MFIFTTHRFRRLGVGGFFLLLLSLFSLVGITPAIAAAGQVTEFPLPASCPAPCNPASLMVRGSDGNLWFSTQFPTGLGRITPTGQVSLFTDPNNQSVSAIIGQNLVLGPDGNVWFLEGSGQAEATFAQEHIGRITPAGQISEFLIPPFKGNRVAANQLAVGSDGNLWFTSNTFAGRNTLSNGFIGRVTTAGVITEFGTPTAVSDPVAIALGSDGHIWFTEESARAIGRITSSGQVTEFPMPSSCTAPCGPAGLMVRGSDGNLWFSTQFPTGLGRITPTGQVSLFTDPNANQLDTIIAGTNLAVGSDGNVWFLESTGDVHDQVFSIGRITTAGQITEFLIPAFHGNRAQAHQLTAAPDGNLWFTSTTLTSTGTQSNGFIGRITTAGAITEFGTPTTVSDPGAIAVGSDSNVWFTETTAHNIGRITTS